ncbi:MAG TPA: EAL domain-containing protein [Gaiellales bacterium]|jgi:EAL domain-containing protein (putative c-di-GMP-specific phosphodiesterase class I)
MTSTPSAVARSMRHVAPDVKSSATLGAGELDLSGILAARALRVVFQPIIDLDQLTVIGYEALARGPRENALEQPVALFAAARRDGLLGELDNACREHAFRAAIQSDRLAPLTLFVNVEPEIIGGAPLSDLLLIAASAPRELKVVFEITERAIAANPAELLRTVERIRDHGWAIALDDVGADPASLAFMSLLRPEVVKLDLRLIHQRPCVEAATIMHAVNAYTENSGALLLAEGIETSAHLDAARALGAHYGQGWLFGRPSSTPSTLPVSRVELPAVPSERSADVSPFSCLPAGARTQRISQTIMCALSRKLEQEALGHGESTIIAAAFQQSRHFTAATAVRYASLVEHAAFVCVIGEGLAQTPIPGVRGATLPLDDPLRDEWSVIVIAPHFCAALLARDLGDDGPDDTRRFEYALTYRREAVTRAACALIARASAA